MSGGTRDVTGVEDRRYRFAVAGVNGDGVVGSAIAVHADRRAHAAESAGAGAGGAGDHGLLSRRDYGNEVHPGNPVYVQAFAIETHEVTNRQFVAFLMEALAQGQVQVSDTAVRAGADTLLIFSGSQIDRDPLGDGFSVPSGAAGLPGDGRDLVWRRRLCALVRAAAAEGSRVGEGGARRGRLHGHLSQTAVHVGTQLPVGRRRAVRLRCQLQRRPRRQATGRLLP